MTHGTMQTMRRAAACAAMLIVAVAASGCNKLKARDLLNKGVAAFKSGQSDTAIENFKQAKEADPELLNAELESVALDDERLEHVWGKKVTRIVLRPKKAEAQGSYTLRLTLVP